MVGFVLLRFPAQKVNGTEVYAYDTLVTYMQRRAKEEMGVALPSNFTFHAITLNNIFNYPDYFIEIDYFKNAAHGVFHWMVPWLPSCTVRVLQACLVLAYPLPFLQAT